MGEQQAGQSVPKVAESDIIGVMNTCGVKMNDNERVTF
jgi:hypothetical protein